MVLRRSVAKLELTVHLYTVKYSIIHNKHHWFSGKIRRCHRRALGSIPGWCIVISF
jgi:hypothetical protein